MQLPGDISTCGATAGVFTQPRPNCDIERREIPQCSSPVCAIPFLWKHGRHRAVKRRDFITLLSGAAAAAWPLAAGAQQSERPRRVGVLMNVAADDPLSTLRVSAFAQAMQELGWTVGRNLRIDYRWGQADPDRLRKYAAELVTLAPEVIVSNANPSTTALQQATRSVPIVFVNQVDPVGAGFVESLARPGGNITGFTNFEYGLSGKWLELLKDVAPRVTG